MECQYCHTNNRKFYCVSCIQEKLQKHGEEMEVINIEKNAAVKQANAFLEEATGIQVLLAEKNKRAADLEAILRKQQETKTICLQKKKRMAEMKREIEHKQKKLNESESRRSNADSKTETNTTKRWQRVHKMTVGTRRILVNEVVALFQLKPGVVEEETVIPAKESLPFAQLKDRIAVEDLYICGVTLPSRLIDVSKYPKEELNAPIGLVIHMLGLIVRYLGIKLPFVIFRKGANPYIKMTTPYARPWHNNRMPLFLDEEDKNFKRFTIGMAMLNYNIAYLCHTQGVPIPLSLVTNTLQNLMSCCRARELGVQSHALIYQGIRDLEFSMDFQQVVRLTSIRYRCSTPLPVQLDLPSKTQDNHSDDGLYLDSEEENMDEAENENENWNLVDVIPAFGTRANNGYEGENIFQLGAANIMPRVTNMVESLSRRSRSEEQEQPLQPHEYFFNYLQRRKK